jgi:tRNA/rRNA methyltransferase
MIAPMEDFRPIHRLLRRIRVVLVSPTHPGNVGATARAMQAMGLDGLWLVDPEDPKIAQRSEAVALASGAARVLGGARVATLAEALGPTHWSCAMSARAREFEPPRITLEQACDELADYLDSDPQSQGAFVFGPERAGLSNDQVLSCGHVCSLDVEDKFSSLNLSQAVQVVAYALRRAARSRIPDPLAANAGLGNQRATARPADHESMMGLHAHLLRVAEQVGYLDPKVPGKFDERLKRFLARKEMWEDEVQMLRGLCTEIERRS